MRDKTYTTFQAADICDVYPSTIISWIKQKRLRAYATPGGHRRILKADLLDFLKKYGLPIPDDFAPARRRILIVEDEPAVGQLLQKVLRQAVKDFEVEWRTDGVGALLALSQNPPDLLVLDVVLPVVDGGSVLASLRKDPQTRSLKVVGITGKRLSPEKLRFMKRHADAFFFKPFDLAAFTAKAAALLGIPAEAHEPAPSR